MYEMIGLGADFMFDVQGGDQIQNAAVQMRGLETQIDSTGHSVSNFSSKMQNMSRGLKIWGAALSASVTAPLVLFTRAVINAGIESFKQKCPRKKFTKCFKK